MANEDDIRNEATGEAPGGGEPELPGWHTQAPAGGSRAQDQPPPPAHQPANPGQPGTPGLPGGPWGAPPPGAWPPPPPGWHPGSGQAPGQPAPPGAAYPGQPGSWGPGGPWAGQWGPGAHPGYGQGGGGWGGYPPGYPPYGYGAGPQRPGDQRRRRRGAIVALLVAGALIIGGAGVGVGVGLGGSSQPAATAPSSGSSGGGGVSGSSGSSGSSGLGLPGGSPQSGGGSVSTSSGSPSNVTAIAKKVDPGLVDINTQLAYQSEQAAGTGMVLTSSGEVLTNNHVIEGATAISVTDLGNGRTYRAKVVGYDRTDDVAVLQLEHASGLTTVKLGSSSALHKGEPIVGIGNAGGAGGTPSVAGGSITALDRSITARDAGTSTSETLHGLVQTNADIRPGDSGGPLVTSAGKVVGMDTAASTNGSFTFQTPSSSATEGFAIPINRAKRIAGQIESGHRSSTLHIGATPFLGVEVTTPDALYSSQGSGFGSGFGGFGGTGNSGTPASPPTSSGAAIAEVLPGTSAAGSRLSQYDIITSLDGHAVTSPTGLTQLLLGTRVGQSITFGYVTPTGTHSTVRLTLKAGPPQ